MTGPEHYREAERLLSHADEERGYSDATYGLMYTRAQVHATLAVAAFLAPRIETWMAEPDLEIVAEFVKRARGAES